MNEWTRQVESARDALGITPDTREGIARRLSHVGMEDAVGRIRTDYRELVHQTGLHERYIEYFAACVVSDFEDGDTHMLPAWLRERLRRWRSHENPVGPGTVRIEFFHGAPAARPPAVDSVEAFVCMSISDDDRSPVLYDAAGRRVSSRGFSVADQTMIVVTPHAAQSSAGLAVTPQPQIMPIHDLLAEMKATDWQPAKIPYGVEVLWPYDVPMLSLDQAQLSALRVDLGSAGLVITWLLVDRFVAFYRGQWVALPLRTVQDPPQPITLQQLYGLPHTALIATFTMPVPLLIDGAAAVHALELETSPPAGRAPIFRHLGEVRPLQPKVVLDGTVPNDEVAFARAWQQLRDLVSVHPAVRPGRGAPKKRTLTPGLRVYSKLVASLYRRKLVEWGEQRARRQAELGEPLASGSDPSLDDRRSLWAGARREARRQIAAADRDTIPATTKQAIEAEAPWRLVRDGGGAITPEPTPE